MFTTFHTLTHGIYDQAQVQPEQYFGNQRTIILPLAGDALIFRMVDVMRRILPQPVPDGAMVYPLLVLCDF